MNVVSTISCLAFVVAVLIGHEHGGNNGKPRDDACKACWLNKSLEFLHLFPTVLVELKTLVELNFLLKKISSISFNTNSMECTQAIKFPWHKNDKEIIVQKFITSFDFGVNKPLADSV